MTSLSTHDRIDLLERDLVEMNRLYESSERKRKALEERVRVLERRQPRAPAPPAPVARRREEHVDLYFYFRRQDGAPFRGLRVRELFERRFGPLQSWRFEEKSRLLMVEFKNRQDWFRCKERLPNLELEFSMKSVSDPQRPMKRSKEDEELLSHYDKILEEE